MGGPIKVVVRDKSGKITPMTRWTNNLGWWIQRPEFITNPSKVLKDYIKAKEESGYYYGKSTLAPEGYGLIVIDEINKIILSHQDYSDLGSTYGSRFSLDLKLHQTLDWKLPDSEIPFINLKKFINQVKKNNQAFEEIGLANNVDEKLETMKRSYQLFKMGVITASKKVLGNLEKHEAKKNKKSRALKNYRKFYKKLGTKKKRTVQDWEYFLRFIKTDLNYSFFDVRLGFKVINFHTEGSPVLEYAKFKEKLKELNFKFTNKDEKAWAVFLKDFQEDE